MTRLRVTGYINTEDLDPGQLDPDHSTGLTDEAYSDLVYDEDGGALKLSDLEDVDIEVE
jgi:hypothetical protein